jgi:hypothetical protein
MVHFCENLPPALASIFKEDFNQVSCSQTIGCLSIDQLLHAQNTLQFLYRYGVSERSDDFDIFWFQFVNWRRPLVNQTKSESGH